MCRRDECGEIFHGGHPFGNRGNVACETRAVWSLTFSSFGPDAGPPFFPAQQPGSA